LPEAGVRWPDRCAQAMTDETRSRNGIAGISEFKPAALLRIGAV
jgi:hypothetical protein